MESSKALVKLGSPQTAHAKPASRDGSKGSSKGSSKGGPKGYFAPESAGVTRLADSARQELAAQVSTGSSSSNFGSKGDKKIKHRFKYGPDSNTFDFIAQYNAGLNKEAEKNKMKVAQ